MTRGEITTCAFLFIFAIAVLNPTYSNRLHAKDVSKADFQKAESLFKQKRFSEALSLYENIISADPSFISGYRRVVNCYTALGDPQGAVIFIESIFLEHPENAEVCYGLGYSLYNIKRYDDAKNYFEKAIQINPDLAEAWNNCAAIYHFVLQDYERARKYYNTAISISSRTGNDRVLKIAKKNQANLPKKEVLQPVTEQLTLEAFLNRFISSVDEGDEKGIRQLVLGQKENSEQALEWLIREAMGNFYQGKTEDEKATLLLAELLEKEYRSSFNSDGLKRQLDAYRKLSDKEKTIRIAGEALLNEGMIKEKNGGYPEALINYKEAVVSFERINDKTSAGLAYIYVGDVQRKMKNYALAHQAYLNGLACFNDTGEDKRKALVLSLLGRTSYLSGEYPEALGFLKQSLEIYRLLKDEPSEKKVQRSIELVMGKIKN